MSVIPNTKEFLPIRPRICSLLIQERVACGKYTAVQTTKSCIATAKRFGESTLFGYILITHPRHENDRPILGHLVRTLRTFYSRMPHRLYLQPSILIVRFMLNLRQLDASDKFSTGSDTRRLSTISAANFRTPTSFLGNVGEPLDYGQGRASGEA